MVNAVDVVGLGAMNIDHLYQVESILQDGEAPVEEYLLSPGGSAANTVYGLARLGVNTGFVGAVGNDELGRMLLDQYAEHGVDTTRIRVKQDGNTGSVLCITDKKGKRSMYVSPGANGMLAWEDVDMDYLNRARMLHTSSFAYDMQLEVQKQVVSALDLHVILSFSPGAMYVAKGLDLLAPLIKRTGVLFVNKDELRQLSGGDDVVVGAQRCQQRGCRNVVVTMGKGETRVGEGGRSKTYVCYILCDKGEYWVERQQGAVSLQMVDATGAGDAFAAGFLYGLLGNKDPYQCGQLGDIAARFSVAKMGAREGFPSLAELLHEYDRCCRC